MAFWWCWQGPNADHGITNKWYFRYFQVHWLGIYPVGKELYTQFATADMLMDISAHAYSPEVVSQHIESVADTLVTFFIMELCNNKRC